MAVIKKGILGGFSGKAGAVVGYHLMEQDIMRGVANDRSKPYSNKELMNQSKFGSTQSWLQPITEVIRIGFAGYKPNSHGFNGAKSFYAHHVVSGLEPFHYVDPALACISHGNLFAGTGLKAELIEDNQILYTWNKKGPFQYNDRAMAVAYDVNNEEADFDTGLSMRGTGKGILEMSEHRPGAEVHLYLGFVTDDRKERSISQYLGMVKIPE
jgi:hypothetical protein